MLSFPFVFIYFLLKAIFMESLKFMLLAVFVIVTTPLFAQTSNDDIRNKVAAVGHDTEKYQADDKVYERLLGCCHYERKKADAKQEHSQHHQ